MSELQHLEETIERLTRAAWHEGGLHYGRIRDGKLYREAEWVTWAEYCATRWNREVSGVDKQIQMARQTEEMRKVFGNFAIELPSVMSQATELARLSKAEDRATVWQRVVSLSNGQGITAQIVKGEVSRYEAEKAKSWLTLAEWNNLDGAEQVRRLSQVYAGTKQFNAQETDHIEWARWSWNPITGCLHNCAYCYARDIADRFYPHKFEPTLHPDRLQAPAHTRPPDVSHLSDEVERIGQRNVFTCSMADLFGKWVPREWIQAVLDQAAANPQWTFLFLTKFPIRMSEFDFPANTWIGTTVDTQYAVERAEKAFAKIRASGYSGVAWLSCEPMMERLTFESLEMFDWLVVGGASKSTQTPEFRPPFEWIVHLWQQAKRIDLPLYMKTNLGIEQRVREYPAALWREKGEPYGPPIGAVGQGVGQAIV